MSAERTHFVRAFLLLISPALAVGSAWGQHTLGSSCGFRDAEYGRSVAIQGDNDGDGMPDLIIGVPRRRGGTCYCLTGSVVLPAPAHGVFGDDDLDRFGGAVAGELHLDGDAYFDAIVGAPGDDDGGSEAGSVVALAGADGSRLFYVHGNASQDALGSSVARVGDLDGDGRDEFLAGAPQFESTETGYALLISGTGTVLRTHAGQSPGDLMGISLVGLSDWNDDGLPDYAIGAPGENGTGRVRVFSGADGAVLAFFDGQVAGDLFGYALGTRTDVDRDGVDELVVGAPRGFSATGAVWVYSGADGSELLQVEGDDVGDWYGASVAGAGDFDGDGFGDVIVGAPAADPFGTLGFGSEAGSATVVSGTDGRTLALLGGGTQGGALGVSVAGGVDLGGDALSDVVVGGRVAADGYGSTSCVVRLTRTRDQRIETIEEHDAQFGESVAGVGDIDSDGELDLLIGAPLGRDDQGQQAGLARLITARTGETIFEWFGDADGDRLGQAVALAGDVNGDGVDDLIVGAATGLRSGPSSGYAKVYSGFDGSELYHFAGDRHFGRAVAGNRDVDGDGVPDVMVGGAAFSGTSTVRIYSGATGQIVFEESQGDHFGYSVELLDDLSGDGHAEYLIGAPRRILDAPFFSTGEVELRSGIDGSILHVFRNYDLNTGIAVARVGDLNADGVADLVLSSWDPQQLWSGGSVWAHSGADYSELWMRFDQVPYEGPSYGYSIASAGDWNVDGVDDVIIGVPGRITNYGASVGSVSVVSGTDGSGLAAFTGYSGWDYFGYSVTSLGDVDADGRVDIAIGAPTDVENPLRAETGQNRVHVVLSSYLERYNYCLPSPNSSGRDARISVNGSGRALQGSLEVSVEDAPSNVSGLFFFGPSRLEVPFGDGRRCVGGSVLRTSVVQVGPQGTAARTFDLGSAPLDAIQPGSEWSAQFWFRDVQAGGSGFNLSDAVRMRFRP